MPAVAFALTAASLGFLAGVAFLAAIEAVALLLAVRWLRRRANAAAEAPPPVCGDLDGERPIGFPCEKQGYMWMLEPEKAPKVCSNGILVGGSKETKSRNNIIEVFPVKKHARLKGHSLSLVSLDGSQQVALDLLKCTVFTVSSSTLSSHKWAKRYPIKIESKEQEIYKGCKALYLYADSSWEKESWCKTLRLASSSSTDKWNNYTSLVKEFQSYISCLGVEYPNFLKPSRVPIEVMDKTSKSDGLSKARDFLKRLAKKASAKHGLEGKLLPGSSANSDKKTSDKVRTQHGIPSSDASSFYEERSSNKPQDLPRPITFQDGAVIYNGQPAVAPTEILDDNTFTDEGTLCLNLLFSRLFFDAKKSFEVGNFIRSRMQRTLSNMRTPSYIGDLTLTNFSLGELPPHVHKMVVLPGDLNELWAFEVDFEYTCYTTLNLETRLEIHAPELHTDIMASSFETELNMEDDSDLLPVPEQRDSQLSSSNDTVDEDAKCEDGLRHTKSTTWTSSYMTRWKTMLHSIADSVSQVPLSLTIVIKSVRGTLRLSAKPPPSDQIWYGFPSMPDINWNLEASIGDKKISNSHIASLLSSRFKAALAESLVLPNCGGICVPFMQAEKDDWVPYSAAPFIFRTNESSDGKTLDPSIMQPQEPKVKGENSSSSKGSLPSTPRDRRAETVSSAMHVEPMISFSESSGRNTSLLPESRLSGAEAIEDLKVPLLNADGPAESSIDTGGSSPEGCLARPLPEDEQQSSAVAEEEGKRKKPWKRAKMMELGKRMGDKLVEKRRDIEEKSKHIVERMRTRGHEASKDS